MEDRNDFESVSLEELPSSALPERKLKRLKKLKSLRESPLKSGTIVSDVPDFVDSEEMEQLEDSPVTEAVGLEESNIKKSEDVDVGTLELENSNGDDRDEFESGSMFESERFGDENGLDSGVDGLGVEENGSGAKRTLEFDVEELDGIDEGNFDHMEVEEVVQIDTRKRSSYGLEEKKDKKKKKLKSGGANEKTNVPTVSKRRADKVIYMFYLFLIA